MKPFIGIKRIWYGAPLTEANTPAKLATWLKTATEVLNSHEGTWGYSQDDPSVTEYKNELNGQVYYSLTTSSSVPLDNSSLMDSSPCMNTDNALQASSKFLSIPKTSAKVLPSSKLSRYFAALTNFIIVGGET